MQFSLLVLVAGSLALAHGKPQHSDARTRDPRILGGTEVSEGEYPYVVAIYSPNVKKALGTATILTSNWVVTTADVCKNALPNSYILAGTVDVQNGGTAIFMKSTEIGSDDENLCLIELQNPITLNENAKRIILPPMEYEWPANTPGDILGWGAMSDDWTEISDTLRVIRNGTQISKQCPQDDEIEDRQKYRICASSVVKGVIPCEGDSGAPLIYNNNILMGIFYKYLPGHETPCSEARDTAYVKISVLVSWIFSAVGKDRVNLLITDESQVPEN